MSKTGSKINGSLTHGRLYESEVQRLQRDADNFTKELESQKRKEVKFKTELSKEAEALKILKDQIRDKRPSTKEQKQKAAIIKRLENQLDKEIVQYNQTVAENKTLRTEIDKYRKDKKAAEEIFSKLMKQKQSIEIATMQTTKERNKELTEIEDATMSTILIKNTYGKKKEEYNANITMLKQRLKEKVEDQKEEERFRSKEADKVDKDQTNPIDTIKMRLDNWKARLKHKKDTLDMYIKHINIIRDAFEQIKKATGISNVQEIVVTFIKSQEQTDALNNHLNALDQELDSLEEQRAEIAKELRLKQALINEHYSKNSNMATAMTKQRDDLKESIETKGGELNRVKKTIVNIQEPVSRMIQKFKSSKISLSVAEDKIYDETTAFNEQNINGYLAEVEEYIKCLLALMAKQFGFEHPMLVALGLEDLPKKIDPASIPKDNLVDTEDEEEPDDATLNDMLDRNKFEMMMSEIMEKRREASKSMVMNSQMEETKNEERKDTEEVRMPMEEQKVNDHKEEAKDEPIKDPEMENEAAAEPAPEGKE